MERRFGWDTHGLPAELEVERQLGITDKSQIDAMGIAAFNDACRESVLRYTDEWRAYVTRQARWVDFDNDYKTLDLPYMESVIWAFKQLWDKGLAYEGYRVLPYCWRDETPLSNHELRMDDDVYQSRQDPALTVGFAVPGRRIWRALTSWYGPRRRGRCRRTRPWPSTPTSPTCRCAPASTASCWPRRDWPPTHESSAKSRKYWAAYRGGDLVGTRYLPPFPYFMDSPNAFQVLASRLRDAPRTAPASCTWRRPTARTTWRPPTRPASCRCTPVDAKRPIRRDRSGLPGAACLRREPADHPRLEESHRPGRGERRGADPAGDLRALPTRTAGGAAIR